MAKCIILSRVSTAQQELDSQTQAIKNEALRCGFKEKDFIIIEDIESAIKLSEEERNGLNKMKEEISKHGDITHVFIYELSRLSRRQLVLFSIRDYLIDRGIQLVCCTPYFRLLENGKLSQTANLMFSIFASMAESEMSLKQERMKRGRNRNKASGKLHCGVLMTGYKTLEDKTIVIDEDEKEFVIDMFNLYSTGMYSLRDVAIELMERYGKVGDTITRMTSKINYMMKNIKYCGDSQYPQIISKELFDKCRAIAAGNQTNNHNYFIDNALCKRIIFDRASGYHLTYSSNSGWPKYSIKSGEKVERSLRVGCKLVDDAIWDLAVALHKAYVTDIGKTRKSLEEKMDVLVTKTMNLQILNKKIDEKIDKIEERLIYNKVSKEKAEQMERTLKKEKKDNGDLIAKYREERKNIKKLLEGPIEMPDYSKFSKDEKIAIIRQMVKKVEVWKDERYKPILDVYTNVDSFKYEIHIDSLTGEKYMKTYLIENEYIKNP